MSYEALTTYLNDHLAGSTAAVQLLDHLSALFSAGRNAVVFSTLRLEEEDDRKLLQRLIEAVGGTERGGRSAIAWVTEQLLEMKLHVDDPTGQLQVFEAVEVLELGTQGKQALWRALEVAAEDLPELRDLDFAELERRAKDQQGRLERMRLDLAPQVLAAPT